MDKQKELLSKLKREDLVRILDHYYDNLGREPTIRPNYKAYSLAELRKCLIVFGIQLTEAN